MNRVRQEDRINRYYAEAVQDTDVAQLDCSAEELERGARLVSALREIQGVLGGSLSLVERWNQPSQLMPNGLLLVQPSFPIERTVGRLDNEFLSWKVKPETTISDAIFVAEQAQIVRVPDGVEAEMLLEAASPEYLAQLAGSGKEYKSRERVTVDPTQHQVAVLHREIEVIDAMPRL